MKKKAKSGLPGRLFRLLFLVMALLAGAAGGAGAEPRFSGEFTTDLSWYAALPYDGSRFDSPLNPDNSLMALEDLNGRSRLMLQLDGGSGEAGFQVMATADLTGEAVTAELLRAYGQVFLGDSLLFKAGRQSFYAGYGYLWNPVNLPAPPPDPEDPEGQRRGRDAVSLTVMGTALELELYALFPGLTEILNSAGTGPAGIALDEIRPGGRLTLYLPGLELILAGLYDHGGGADNGDGDDVVPALAAAFLADLRGVGLYAEGRAGYGSPRAYPDGSGGTFRKSGWLFSALAGGEYTFPSGTYAALEYRFDGAGFSEADWSAYSTGIDAAAAALPGDVTLYAAMAGLYDPAAMGRHYGALNFSHTFWDQNLDLAGVVVWGIDTAVLAFMPELVWKPGGGLSLSAAYSGFLSLPGGGFNEARLAPVKHALTLGLACYF